MDQPVAASKATRTPRGGASRAQNNSNGRGRKNGHALKFHNFIANDSWSAATHCLREEHGTKQITVSHWTPSQGNNNKNTLVLSHTLEKTASQSKQQQEQSQHPSALSRAVSQQHHSSRRVSNDQLFSSHNNSPSEGCTPGHASQSILESLLAKNILAQGHSSSPCARARDATHARRVKDAKDERDERDAKDARDAAHASPSAGLSARNAEKNILQTMSKKESTESKVNRRKAFVVRRVVQSTTLPLGQMEKSKNTCHQRSMVETSSAPRAPRDKINCALLLCGEEPLDLSTKKMDKQFNGRPVISKSCETGRVESTRQASADKDSVEYLIRSVEQSAAEAASIIARVNGSYTNSSSSFSASSFSPSPGTSSDYFTSPSTSSVATHNSTVTSIANWVEMNKSKDSDMMINNRHNTLPFTAAKSTVRQKLEDAFRQNGFLVKTKQVSDGDATFCKFRQLRKYTRYYLKSWHKHLPDEVSQLYKVSYKNFKGFLPPNSDRR